MTHKSIQITDGNWTQEIQDYQGVAFVDIWAPWCAPCRMIGPVVEELAGEYAGKAKISKLNADENQKPAELGVSGIPTMLIFKNGNEVDRIVGVVPKQTLVEKLDYYLTAN
ncbi:MAG: thioredoxin [Candidatus Marinimicrobia bacterium]|jgi:thioredoxin 1|nr:thioredoxin [Candidatus Neomarinimicrobiota bacterium]